MHTVILRSEYQRELAKQYIDKAPADAVMRLSKPTRSLDQNSKMWVLLSDISRAKPLGRRHPPEGWKNLFMYACGHEIQFEQGLDGRPFPVGFRTSKMTSEQMSDLIEYIYAFGSEHGVTFTQ